MKNSSILAISTVLPGLKNTHNIGRHAQSSRRNKLHKMQRPSYILNVKVKPFKPSPHGLKKFNCFRFESNTVKSLYNSKKSRLISLVQ